MKNNNLRRIKIATKDGVAGFHVLLLTNTSIFCLPDNEYIVCEEALSALLKGGIEFELKANKVKKGNKVRS